MIPVMRQCLCSNQLVLTTVTQQSVAVLLSLLQAHRDGRGGFEEVAQTHTLQ